MRLQVAECSIQGVNKHEWRHLVIVIMPGHVRVICFHLGYTTHDMRVWMILGPKTFYIKY